MIINHACRRLAEWTDRPLTEYDLECGRIDQELDELAARRATRPLTNGCEVIAFPRPRQRGDAS